MPIFFPEAVDEDDADDDFPGRGLAAAGDFAAVFDGFAAFAAGFAGVFLVAFTAG